MSYTELLTLAAELRAAGVRSDPSKLGVVEGAAGRLGRALSMLEVGPEGSTIAPGLSPRVLHEVGRDLVLRGEAVYSDWR